MRGSWPVECIKNRKFDGMVVVDGKGGVKIGSSRLEAGRLTSSTAANLLRLEGRGGFMLFFLRNFF